MSAGADVYPAALSVEARCPGGQDSTHNLLLLGLLSVGILQVLLSTMRGGRGLLSWQFFYYSGLAYAMQGSCSIYSEDPMNCEKIICYVAVCCCSGTNVDNDSFFVSGDMIIGAGLLRPH